MTTRDMKVTLSYLNITERVIHFTASDVLKVISSFIMRKRC